MAPFKIKSPHIPAGDQPKAIESLIKGFNRGERHQTLLGVTGSGKTFTAANVIEAVQKPTLVIAHNKTLAAQLAQEYREFFPDAAVHYFVSYYDYYQPEAYIPHSDTYIEKEAQINEEIERLRHASTQALLTRSDVIIVASVSCIYGLGSPTEYRKMHLELAPGMQKDRAQLVRDLIGVYYERTPADLTPGTFRPLGNSIEIMPVNERVVYKVDFEGPAIGRIRIIDAVSRQDRGQTGTVFLFPARHYVTPENERSRAIDDIRAELKQQLAKFEKAGKLLEAERLKRRVNYDLAMIREIGYCNGIENYSRHFDGRAPGEPPYTLLDYFPHHKDGSPDFLTVIDESHVTVPQIGGMYNGDRARKETLVDHGFRLPSAVDNRPLKFDEFTERVGQVIYTSATPSTYEREKSGGNIVEQIIRPTGLTDPEVKIRPVTGEGDYKGQVQDVLVEATKVIDKGARVLVTTLTKKMAEDLDDYLRERGYKSAYLHSDVETLERIETLTKLRKGEYDVLVGVNLLREGLDLPEVELVAILDADKEGFLRSETSLIQTIGRAARNSAGRVILYADQMTKSLDKAVGETRRRRQMQIDYNTAHGITPQTIKKNITDITQELRSEHSKAIGTLLAMDAELYKKNPRGFIAEKKREMTEAVKNLDFETAALIRDEIQALMGGGKSTSKKPVKKAHRK
jgi:excinuclease ABC subunit B